MKCKKTQKAKSSRKTILTKNECKNSKIRIVLWKIWNLSRSVGGKMILYSFYFTKKDEPQ